MYKLVGWLVVAAVVLVCVAVTASAATVDCLQFGWLLIQVRDVLDAVGLPGQHVINLLFQLVGCD